MIGIIVITHGQLANELVNAAEIIVGEIPNVTAVSIGWHFSPRDAEREIQDAIEKTDSGQGAVILTDMFGGTPSNLSLTFLEKNRVEVITGVNLPMFIKLVDLRQQRNTDLLEVARQTCKQGKESIYLASDLLSAKGEKDEEKEE